MIKKIIITLLSCFLAMNTVIPVSAEEKTAIVKAVITDAEISAYINLPDISDCSVQLGQYECEVKKYTKAGSMPSDTLILVDASGSIPKDIQGKTTELIEMLIDEKNENERYSVASFGTDIEYLCDYTQDRYELIKAIGELKYDQKYTYIYSVLDNALSGLSKASFSKIIIISDGVENSKDGITYNEILLSVSESMCPIYTIGIENNNQESLKRLYAFSRNSFGQSYTLTFDSDIRSLCSIINESRDFICIDIAFPSEAADGNEKFLKISGNGFECGCDIRMPVISAPQKEYITEETAITEDVLKSEYELSELQDSAQSNTKSIVMICIACAAFCTIFIVIFINKKSPKKNSNISSDTYIDQENIATQIRRSYSGILTETGECSIRLTDINAPERSFRCAVGQGVIIGRNAKQCMIVIDYDGYVSRRHCRIFRDNEKFYIENLSKNQPVIINEKDIIDKISSLSNHIPDSGTKILIPYQGSATTYAKEIFSGDIIQVGHTSLRFEIL